MTMNEETEPTPKRGLADAMCKILRKNKKLKKNAETFVLSKAKTDRERLQAQKDSASEDEGPETKKIKREDNKKSFLLTEAQRKKIWEDMGRVKPDVLDKDYERNLRRIASKGVVQLFNAVQEQQKLIDKAEKNTELSRSKKDVAIKSLTKGKFLDCLNSKLKQDVKVEEGVDQKEATWAALREDFMMGGKIKDWDQDDSDEASDK